MNECKGNHEYVFLENSRDLNESKYIFYCKKCLDIQKRDRPRTPTQ